MKPACVAVLSGGCENDPLLVFIDMGSLPINLNYTSQQPWPLEKIVQQKYYLSEKKAPVLLDREILFRLSCSWADPQKSRRFKDTPDRPVPGEWKMSFCREIGG